MNAQNTSWEKLNLDSQCRVVQVRVKYATTCIGKSTKVQGLVVQQLDNAVHWTNLWINLSLVELMYLILIRWILCFPLDSYIQCLNNWYQAWIPVAKILSLSVNNYYPYWRFDLLLVENNKGTQTLIWLISRVMVENGSLYTRAYKYLR